MSFLMFCFYALVLLLIYWLWNTIKIRSTLPPGPFPLPFFGNLLQLDPIRPHSSMLEWSKSYGPVITVWIANKPAVMVMDYEIMKDALVKHGDQLANRPRMFVLDHFTGGNYGLIMASGSLWKEQRRFSLHTLRNFGLGKNVMEQNVLTEVSKMCTWLEEDLGEEQNGKALDISKLLHCCISNIISSIVFGHSFDRYDNRFIKIKQMLEDNFQLLVSRRSLLLNSYPWLGYVPLFNNFGLKDMKRQNEMFLKFLQEEIDQHKVDMVNDDPEEEPKDFTMAYLQEIARRKSRGEDQSYYSEWQLLILIADLWVAGMETTITTLRWGVLAMMMNPEIQRKVQQEIDTIIGPDRPPTMSDMKEMPYVTAVINEMQRWGNIFPFNISRTNEVDCQLGAYNIPAGIEVVPQVSVLHIDPKIFPSPEVFDPERFLAKNNKIEQFNPFSLGKRQCLGESLARMELFLVFVSIMLRYNLSVVKGEPAPSLVPLFGVTSSPAKFQCFVSRR